jgi:hypothetical protein
MQEFPTLFALGGAWDVVPFLNSYLESEHVERVFEEFWKD